MLVAVAIANRIEFDFQQRLSLLGGHFGFGNYAGSLGLGLFEKFG